MKLRSLLSVLLLASQVVSAKTIDKIIVFGDSITDNGNIYALTTEASKNIPNTPIVPKSPPYYQGHFSNGPVWAEDLAALFNVPLSDYAYGGAWVEPYHDSKQVAPFSVKTQIDFYAVSAALDFHKGDHLYAIWAGANDYIKGRPDEDYATTNTIYYMNDAIESLVYHGAKNILVVTMPDLSVLPGVRLEGPEIAAQTGRLARAHNEKLKALIDKLKLQYPDVKFIIADVMPHFQDMDSNPEKYNLKNVNSACYPGNYSFANQLKVSPAFVAAKKANLDIENNLDLRVAFLTGESANSEVPCDEPDTYLFWDKIHPTRVVHQIIANYMRDILQDNGINA